MLYQNQTIPPFKTVEMIKLDIIRVSGKDIMAKTRKREVVLARQAAMMLTKVFTDLNNTDIGRAFNKDHATTVYAIQCVKDAVETNYRPMLDTFEPLYKEYYTEFLIMESFYAVMSDQDKEYMNEIRKRVTVAVQEFHNLYTIRFKLKFREE